MTISLFYRICICILFMSMSVLCYGQQDSQYTQYMYNTQTINPAYAGSRGVPSFLALYRAQWVGLDGAPETFNFTGSLPLGIQKKVGAGFSITQDKAGPLDETNIVGDISYSVNLGPMTKMAFGVKAGINLLNVDFSRVGIFDPNDPIFEQNIDNRLNPVVGTGIYIYDESKWYVGLSVPNFLETTYYDDTTVSSASERAAFYGIAGYVFDVGANVKLKPAMLTKIVSGAPVAWDVSLNALINDSLTLGAGYRLDAAFSALAGFQISRHIMVGYAYDYGIQDFANFNQGSHEVFLRFELGSNSRENMISPRFF